MNIIDEIFGFITGLGVITGGVISIAWFAGSLLVYCLLDRPIWEKTILLGITIFILIGFACQLFESLRATLTNSPMAVC